MDKKSRWLLKLISAAIQVSIAVLLSLAITIVNAGFGSGFLIQWAKGFVVALVIIPPALRLIPPVTRGIRAILGNRPLFVIRCAVSICFATLMEGMISFAITLAQYGVAPGWLAAWGVAFVKALPVGLFIGFTMTFLVQPRLAKLAMAGRE